MFGTQVLIAGTDMQEERRHERQHMQGLPFKQMIELRSHSLQRFRDGDHILCCAKIAIWGIGPEWLEIEVILEEQNMLYERVTCRKSP